MSQLTNLIDNLTLALNEYKAHKHTRDSNNSASSIPTLDDTILVTPEAVELIIRILQDKQIQIEMAQLTEDEMIDTKAMDIDDDDLDIFIDEDEADFMFDDDD